MPSWRKELRILKDAKGLIINGLDFDVRVNCHNRCYIIEFRGKMNIKL